MELQSSYIFISRADSSLTKDEKGNYSIVLGNSIYSHIERIFPTLKRTSASVFHYKTEYCCEQEVAGCQGKLKFTINEVVSTTFLDITVSTKTAAQAVKMLEYIQTNLLSADLAKNYIHIVSYDAISEYFCNKAFPKLNTLERNLRKLLFNTYVSEFGKDYYQVTINEQIQGKAKQRVGSKGGKKTIEIRRIQEFFYSLEYGEIEEMLFTPGWTKLEEDRKNTLLDKSKDLSQMSDDELRNALQKIRPQSDWERFFSSKVFVADIETAMTNLRVFRNSVAHVKFFERTDYEECNKLIKRLNSAILDAIRITEERDFAEKNREALQNAVSNVLQKVEAFTRWVGEKSIKTAQVLAPMFEKLGRIVSAIENDDARKNRLSAEDAGPNLLNEETLDGDTDKEELAE